MSSVNQEIGIRTPEERDAVTAFLMEKGGEWTSMPPDYTAFSREAQAEKLEDVHKAVSEETDAPQAAVDAAYEKSLEFLDSSFDFYEGKRDLGRKIGRAFVVPMRSDRLDDNYASESNKFYPLCDPKLFGVTSEMRMRTIYGLPPAILDTYLKSPYDNETGALVLAPVYSDMQKDLWPNKGNMAQQIRFLEVGKAVLEKTAQFAHLQLGADVIGLGAILPKVTSFGQVLRSIDGMDNLVTTTGHGGTVYMIVETARKVMEETSVKSHGKIGVIGGAGSIGWSSTVATTEMIPGHRIYSYDINNERLYGMIGKNRMSDKVTVMDSASDILRVTNIILTAVTGRINLDDSEFAGLDLTGKVIIDDSQPGAFDAAQVEARGGKLIWVVGEDATLTNFITRDGYYTAGTPYNYGDNSGLWGDASEFACGQEAAVIAQSGEYQHAISAPVTPENVRVIGELFRNAGITVAPFQAFGQRVHID
ncbi:MAG TPA: hypothetical protein VMT96_00540 [Candidatus Bathyarchaeia archaeon]|nr:hypothetical protein [Candidatus Bathyarchaeia archaeon]